MNDHNLPRSPAHREIPGGAHTYSKGDDQFPANAPHFLERGEGAYVWDEHNHKFLDWTMGLRTMTLGYGYPGINEAAIRQIEKGNNFGRPSAMEHEAAQDLMDLVPGTEMVKFAKNGSTVTTAAVKLARAFTGRDKVLFCKDHPFFSYDDWFIGTTPADGGIPQLGRELAIPFNYNDLESVTRAFEENVDQVACLIMEASTYEEPRDGFLLKVQDLCKANGTVFVIDEMITGFRWHLNGAQTLHGIEPDLSTFGKGIANGYPVAALVGKREIMELGGIHHDKKRVFLISTTHGGENLSLAAMRAALMVYREQPVVAHLWKVGGALIEGLNEAAKSAGLADYFEAYGFSCSPYFACYDQSGAPSAELRTLFLQEMIKRNIVVNYFSPSYSHSMDDVSQTIEAAAETFQVYARAVEHGSEGLLQGPAVKPVFRPYN